MSFNISIIQFDIIYKEPTENRDKVKSLVNKSLVDNPDLIVLPETWTTGFNKEIFVNADKYAETGSGKTITMLRKLAARYGIWIVSGSIIEKSEGEYYNTVFLIDRKGDIVGKYRKIHLFSVQGEDQGLKKGTKMPVFATKFGNLALMTCYDIRFPELMRTYASKGAEGLIVVANFPEPRLNHWRVLLQARAIENQLYVIACNRIGTGYFGHSMIIDPWGDIIDEGEKEQSFVKGTIDFERVKEVREQIPVFKDRNLK